MTDRGPIREQGAELPFAEQWIRHEAHARIFGEAQPLRLGRYQIRERLGAGGMGSVFAAWDADLERKVAIKVFHERIPQAGAHLEREARAQAALAHPNVVMVFEVGESADTHYIVMEHVDGPTLRTWQTHAQRTTAELVQAYRQAASGLAAAHHAGLVHADFKPDNVLVHGDGRVRVADFGLAARRPPSTTTVEALGHDTATDGHSATLAGGTPGYMAPELAEGIPAGPRSDQYAFCVALFEALNGHRPGDERRPGRPVPRRVQAAIERGLQTDPERRFESMDALRGALAPVKRRWLLVAATIGMATAAALAFGQGPSCDKRNSETWSRARAEVQNLVHDADADWVRPTWPHLDREVSAYEANLSQLEQETCRLAQTRSTQQQRRAEECLSAVSDEFRGFIEQLRSDPAARRSAVLRVALLLAPQTCRDDAALERFETPEDLELRQRLQSAVIAHARLPSKEIPSQPADLEHGLAADPSTAVLAYRALALDALDHGRPEDAADALQEAASLAESLADQRARAELLGLLAFAVGQDTRRARESKQLTSQALAALDAGPEYPTSRAGVLHHLASVAAHARPPDLDEAIRLHREAVASLQTALGNDHPLTLRARQSLGAALTRARRLDEAVPILEAVTTEVDEVWPAEAPTRIQNRRLLGLAHLAAGDASVALGALQDARDARARLATPPQVERARDHYNVAVALRALGRNREVISEVDKGLPLAKAALGADHPELTPWWVLRGHAARALDRSAESAQAFERALVLLELDGAEPKEFAKVRVSLAQALRKPNPDAALVHLEAAFRFLRQTEGFDGLRERANALREQLAKAEGPQPIEAQSRNR